MTENSKNLQTIGNNDASSRGITVPFLILTVTFVVCLLVANLVEIKTIDLGWFTITAGVVVFPLSYIINDCVVEVYGFARARLMIWVGLAMSMLTALMLHLAIALPGGADWQWQESMTLIYGSVPRIMGASFAAFVCGSMANALVMSVMKRRALRRPQGSTYARVRSFSTRAIVSTLWGETIDSLVFFPIAFGGVLPWSVVFSLIVTQAMVKTGYEILVLPLTNVVVARLKKMENIDITDSPTRFEADAANLFKRLIKKKLAFFL